MGEKLHVGYTGHSVGDFVVELPGWQQEVFRVVATPTHDSEYIAVRLADERREMVTGRKNDQICGASPSRFGQIAADKKAHRQTT